MENNLFKIHSNYKPTGDQPTAIDSIVKNIKNGVKLRREKDHSYRLMRSGVY